MERSGHPDLCIQRLRTKHQHSFERRLSRDRTIGIISIRLTSRPTGNRVLKLLEDPDIQTISRAGFHQKGSKGVLGIILVSESENRFFTLASKPGDSLSGEVSIPF